MLFAWSSICFFATIWFRETSVENPTPPKKSSILNSGCFVLLGSHAPWLLTCFFLLKNTEVHIQGWVLASKPSRFLPDPGALNSCMHTFPEKNDGLTWFNTQFSVFGHGIQDPRFEILRVENLRTDRASMLLKSYQSSSVIAQGVSRETFRLFNRRLVTTFYGVSNCCWTSAPWIMDVPRETPDVTTKPNCYDLTNILVRPVSKHETLYSFFQILGLWSLACIYHPGKRWTHMLLHIVQRVWTWDWRPTLRDLASGNRENWPCALWGFYYNFTNYNFNKHLEFQSTLEVHPFGKMLFYLQEINVFSESIVGEIVVESPYERSLSERRGRQGDPQPPARSGSSGSRTSFAKDRFENDGSGEFRCGFKYGSGMGSSEESRIQLYYCYYYYY